LEDHLALVVQVGRLAERALRTDAQNSLSRVLEGLPVHSNTRWIECTALLASHKKLTHYDPGEGEMPQAK